MGKMRSYEVWTWKSTARQDCVTNRLEGIKVNRPRGKMSRENRAKQFMPFAALKGLEEALEKKEKIVVPKAELCDDYKEQLDFRLSQMQCGDMVTVVYFSEDNYVRITGILSKIKLEERWIQVVRTKIHLDDIYEFEK